MSRRLAHGPSVPASGAPRSDDPPAPPGRVRHALLRRPRRDRVAPMTPIIVTHEAMRRICAATSTDPSVEAIGADAWRWVATVETLTGRLALATPTESAR